MRVHKQVYNALLIEAAKAFVLAAYPLVPVETGMSRGSYLKLAKLLNINIPIIPKRHKIINKRYKTKKGIVTKREVVDISKKRYYLSRGRSIPKNKYSGAKLTKHELIANSARIRFLFHTKVLQYNILDTQTNKTPTGHVPWQSFKAGYEAFNKVLDNFQPPDLDKFVTHTRLSVGVGSRGVISTQLPARKQKTRYGP